MIRKSFFYVLYAILLVALCVAIGLAFHSNSSSKPKPAPVAKVPAGSSVQKANPQVAQPKTTSKSTAAAGQSTGSSAGGASALANSGPGDVIGIFAVSFVVGTVGFSQYRRKTL